jgi:hypothetical protein
MAIISNFGVINGFHTWRVNGTRDEIKALVAAMEEEGAPFKNGVAPVIHHVHRGGYTVLLELLLSKGAATNGPNKPIKPANVQNIAK